MSKLTLEDSLIETIGGSGGYEVLKEGAEIAIDSALKNGLLKDIPIVGAITSLVNGCVGAREYILLKKLLRFITAISPDSEEIKKYIAELESSPAEKRKLGERLFLVLDRLGDIEKCEFVAKAFKVLVSKRITMDIFLRFLDVIDRSFLPDVILLQNEQHLEKLPAVCLASLSTAGLLTLQIMPSYDSLSGYEVSALGALFAKHILAKQG